MPEIDKKRMDRIAILYRRTIKVEREAGASDAPTDLTWEYGEQVVIDRETESIRHLQHFGEGCQITHDYRIAEGVADFLDHLDASLFTRRLGSEQGTGSEGEAPRYALTLDFAGSSSLLLEGVYDQEGLPQGWGEFAEKLRAFLDFYGPGDILNPLIYGKVNRKASELMFVSVVLLADESFGYYRADDDTLEIGDCVLVPIGQEDLPALARVVDIDYFRKEEAPFPVEMAKLILRKCQEEDLPT